MKPTDALISVKPKYADKILSGEKTAELRTRRMKIAANSRIWIYSTAPEASIVGYVKVERVVRNLKQEIWKNYSTRIAIDHNDFKEYLASTESATVILIRDVEILVEPITLLSLRSTLKSFSPPQFFYYLEQKPLLHKLLNARKCKTNLQRAA